MTDSFVPMAGSPPIPDEISRRFTLAEQLVPLPGFPVTLLKPRNSDDLISEADYVVDERLPYWADLWHSAEVLSTYMLEHGPAMLDRVPYATDAGARPRALELGCGLGVVSIACERVGFEALATDYYDDSLLFAAYNAERALGRTMQTRMVDWTKMPSDLGKFSLVIAADVLYEMRYAAILADAVAMTLAPGGVFVLADQGRIALGAFMDEAEKRGIEGRATHRLEAPRGVAKPSVTIYELRWKA
jgi:predicted nicotinamide N-methyase